MPGTGSHCRRFPHRKTSLESGPATGAIKNVPVGGAIIGLARNEVVEARPRGVGASVVDVVEGSCPNPTR